MNNNNESALQVLNDMGHKITSVSTDDNEGQFLFQRLYRSAEIQRHRCMSRLEMMSIRTFSRPAFLTCLAFNPRDLYYRWYKYNKNNNNQISIVLYDCKFRGSSE